MLELLKSVFTAQSPDDSVLPDVMATIFATVLAELSFFSSHVSIASESVYVPYLLEVGEAFPLGLFLHL